MPDVALLRELRSLMLDVEQSYPGNWDVGLSQWLGNHKPFLNLGLYDVNAGLKFAEQFNIHALRVFFDITYDEARQVWESRGPLDVVDVLDELLDG